MNLKQKNKLFNLTSCNLLIAAIITLLLVTSCNGKTNIKNPYVQVAAEDAHIAKVYFIRPRPIKFKGVADDKLTVELNNELLLKISEGQYTMIKLKPAKASITTRSKTMFINKTQPIDVSRTREYRFIAGKTYFIHLKRIDEEFRGIYYDPAPVTYEQALKLSDRLHKFGAANQEPIDEIKDVAEAPLPSALEPALPESLYPGKPYLIKGNPQYVAPTVPESQNEITFDKPPEPTQPAQPNPQQ